MDGFARRVDGLESEVDDLRGERNRRELRAVVEEFKESVSRSVLGYLLLSRANTQTFTRHVGCERSHALHC